MQNNISVSQALSNIRLLVNTIPCHHLGYIEIIFLLKGWSTECRANSGKY